MNFATRYKPNQKRLSVMDQHDCVDRLSYVDSTKMVQRMIAEGHNLMAYRALALNRGQYSLDDLADDETLPALGVYEEDPAIAGAKLEAYKKELKGRQSETSIESKSEPEVVEKKVESSSDSE